MASGQFNDRQENLERDNGIGASEGSCQQPRSDQNLLITPEGQFSQANDFEVKQAWGKENILCFGKETTALQRICTV